MGNRPRIAKPNAQQKARSAVRELYSDLIDNLTNNECDLIIQARIDGLGPVFIVQLITSKRIKHQQHNAEVEKIYNEIKNAQA